MPLYRYLGDNAELLLPPPVGVKTLRAFGESIELPQEIADSFIEHGKLQILPAADFDAIGFTDEELKAYPTAKAQKSAPPEFQDKKQKALDRLHELRDKQPIDESKQIAAAPEAEAAKAESTEPESKEASDSQSESK